MDRPRFALRRHNHPYLTWATFGGVLLLTACNTVVNSPSQAAATTSNNKPAPTATAPAAQTPPESRPAAAGETDTEESAVAPHTDTVLLTGKTLHTVNQGASESPRNDGVHDPSNDAIDVLQDPNVAMAQFPRDRRHQVDWVQTLEQGLIAPRADIEGKGEMPVLDLDILMKNTQFMPWVKFPHVRHTQWLACSNCHPAIFAAKENANPISMNKVLRGEYCGVCHDKVAFALFTCERCHSVPHAGSGPKWW
jgi:c(7)-type cytochrome triheme protein